MLLHVLQPSIVSVFYLSVLNKHLCLDHIASDKSKSSISAARSCSAFVGVASTASSVAGADHVFFTLSITSSHFSTSSALQTKFSILKPGGSLAFVLSKNLDHKLYATGARATLRLTGSVLKALSFICSNNGRTSLMASLRYTLRPARIMSFAVPLATCLVACHVLSAIFFSSSMNLEAFFLRGVFVVVIS